MPAIGQSHRRNPLRFISVASALILAGGLLRASSTVLPHDVLLTAKRAASDANYRNDQAALRGAVAAFASLAADEQLRPRALYWAAWTEWMLAASQQQDNQAAAAVASLESAVARLTRLIELQPDDADAHALLAFVSVAIATAERPRWKELAPGISAHRRRALELAPANPRVVMLDAMMIFYAPPQAGGSQTKGVARWLEALQLLAAERPGDATAPDWGRTLAEGWLANLYLTMTPPHDAEARDMAAKALRERPDFWYVATQVMPRIHSP